jgi:hypothetical protein
MEKTGPLLQSHNYHTAGCNLRLVLSDPRTRSPGYFKAAVNFLDMVLVLYFLFLFLRRVLFLWFVRQPQSWLTRYSHAHTPVTGNVHKHSAWLGISSSRADKHENRKTCVNTYRSAYERRHSFRGSYSCSNRSFLCCLWIFFSFLMMLSSCSNSSFLLPHVTGSRSPTRPVSHFPAPVSALILCVLCVMAIRPVSVLSVFTLFVRSKKLGCRDACGGEEDLMPSWSSTLKLKCLPKLLGGFKLIHQGGKVRGGGAGGRRDSNKISVHGRRPQMGQGHVCTFQSPSGLSSYPVRGRGATIRGEAGRDTLFLCVRGNRMLVTKGVAWKTLLTILVSDTLAVWAPVAGECKQFQSDALPRSTRPLSHAEHALMQAWAKHGVGKGF